MRKVNYLEKANQYAAKSLELDADCPQAHFVRGAIEFIKGNLQEASHIFKKVHQLDPSNTDAMFWLTVSYFASGRPDASWPISKKLFAGRPIINNVACFAWRH